MPENKWDAWHSISTTTGWKIFAEEAEKKMGWYQWELNHNEQLSGDQMKNMQLILKGMRMIMNIPRQLEHKKTRTETSHNLIEAGQRR